MRAAQLVSLLSVAFAHKSSVPHSHVASAALFAAGRQDSYNTAAKIVKGAINVHLVPHSHDDGKSLRVVTRRVCAFHVGGLNIIFPWRCEVAFLR